MAEKVVGGSELNISAEIVRALVQWVTVNEFTSQRFTDFNRNSRKSANQDARYRYVINISWFVDISSGWHLFSSQFCNYAIAKEEGATK